MSDSFLVDNSFKEFANETKEADRIVLWWGWIPISAFVIICALLSENFAKYLILFIFFLYYKPLLECKYFIQ